MARPRGYDRDTVLDKAMSMFWRLGYEGAHLAALVEHTGLNRFSLYKEFGGKAGLYEAALDRFLGYLLGQYRDILTVQPQGLENIEAVLRSLQYGSEYYGCFMINTLTQRDSVPPGAYDRAVAGAGEIEALYRANLAGALARGQIAAASDIAGLGKMLQTLDQGLHIQGLAGTTDAQKDAIITAAMAGLQAR
ncbi:MAG: TetR/AcrR family transcriptional regulator [Alphaproteobacteria bacterium]|jgi:AcrR family transcriptional regulator|nr:TetR/AcrR family transcriptional regulator [Alphaproteobacteria bacterium]MBU1560937.1 TetR/AcrR family transcriptional regulator [Alphaproteobacteria bacterium]MBU2304911.1 TetR/AcrR family transcriptional regulator [Alphaproteobacteria bacterium]MBU2370162.1 TetR/AcrR family transcriptional regulator [Alphaproteobacteria bacterium]